MKIKISSPLNFIALKGLTEFEINPCGQGFYKISSGRFFQTVKPSEYEKIISSVEADAIITAETVNSSANVEPQAAPVPGKKSQTKAKSARAAQPVFPETDNENLVDF